MKKTLLMAGALLALTVGVASAQSGLNLSWVDCGASGNASRTSACLSNSGSNPMVGSIVLGVAMPQLNGHEGVFDLQTNQPALSEWWNIPGCRATSAVNASFDFTANSNCVDPWGNAGFGGVNYTYQFNGLLNRARIRTVYAINPSTSANGTDEYYVARVSINNSKTVGTGACAGCQDGACIVFNSSKMTQPSGSPSYTISGPVVRDYVTWQSGGGLGGECPGVTPTKSATWGSVKSLYR